MATSTRGGDGPPDPGSRVLAHSSPGSSDLHSSYAASHAQRFAAFMFALGIGWLGHRVEQNWLQRDHVDSAAATHGSNAMPAGDALVIEPHTRIKDAPARVAGSNPVSAIDPQLGAKVDPRPSVTADPQPSPGITVDPSVGPFAAADDAKILQSLRESPLLRIKKGTGGRSLAFKITLQDGTQGYFKPEQQVSSAHWYAEIAAYYLDRALGLGRVAPVAGRRFAWSQLEPSAADDPRVSEVAVGKDGKVRGAFVHWLSGALTPAVTPPGWENWLRMEPFARSAISPYQRPAVYGAQLAAARTAATKNEPGRTHYDEVPTPANPDLPAALSDMIVFDFLTLNYDRWGGDNTNVLTFAREGQAASLIYLDNGDGFSVGPARRSLLDARLSKLQRFRKRTIDSLRALDIDALGKQLAADALGPILDSRMLSDLKVRQKAVLDHVAAQQRRFGDSVYAW